MAAVRPPVDADSIRSPDDTPSSISHDGFMPNNLPLRRGRRTRDQPEHPSATRDGGRGVNVIETHALGKSCGSTRALHDCTLAIPGRHVVALVGPNGAGKSTLLNMAVGLVLPTPGEGT